MAAVPSAPGLTGCSRPCARDTARCLSCGRGRDRKDRAGRVRGRARRGLQGRSARQAWSRRWSSRSRRCTSCARRCSTGSSACRRLSGTALATAFGLSTGTPPDRFIVGLAVLGLLSDAAHEPLLCLVDDAHWLDRVSAQVLAFVARRLQAESVALLFATRTTSDDDPLTGLPELLLDGLSNADARELLISATPGRLDDRVAERIVAETHGNPLALLELPRTATPAELAGGFGLPATLPLPGRIEESFRQRIERLSPETHRLLLLAAADPVGDPALLRRAAALLGIRLEAAEPAEAAGLLQLGGQVRFHHPLVRSAVYRAAAPEDRRQVHRALADATDPEVDPDRRAWHRAQAAAEPDEDVASELERSADRAQARGGLAAAAAFLERAAMMTPDRHVESVGRWRRPRPSRQPAPPGPPSSCLLSPKRGRSTSFSAPSRNGCARNSRSCNDGGAMPRRSCSGPRSDLSRSTPSSRSKRTSNRWWPHCPSVAATPWCKRLRPSRQRRGRRRPTPSKLLMTGQALADHGWLRRGMPAVKHALTVFRERPTSMNKRSCKGFRWRASRP